MKAWCAGILVACVTLVGLAANEAAAGEGWTTYRSDRFGYELSYPPSVELRAYFGGSSGDLKETTTGRALAALEVWPPDECPRQPPDAVARDLGIERAKAATQADGPDGSSYCEEPVTVHESVSAHGVTLYELTLTCVRETYPGGHDDTEEVKTAHQPQAAPTVTPEGTKGPTYFADISPAWKKRVLMADPARSESGTGNRDAAVVREVLATLQRVPAEKPAGRCIEELQDAGRAIGVLPRAR